MSTGGGAPTLTFTVAKLPECLPTVVYIARDEAGTVLYVGMTGSLGTRLAAHQRQSPWWASVATMSVETWPTRAAAGAREEELIEQHDPPGNRTEKWREKKRVWREREAAFVALRDQGITLEAAAGRLGVGYGTVAALSSRLRKVNS